MINLDLMDQEEPEVPNKDPKGFQTLKLAQSSSSAVPVTQKPVEAAVGETTPKDRGSRRHHCQWGV